MGLTASLVSLDSRCCFVMFIAFVFFRVTSDGGLDCCLVCLNPRCCFVIVHCVFFVLL